MTYRERDPLENVGKQQQPKASTDERRSPLRTIKRVVRDAIMRQVSTKQ